MLQKKIEPPIQSPFLGDMELADQFKDHLDLEPRIDPTAFVHPSAVLIGDVTVGPRASVWPLCVLRGDIHSIVIGEGSNVQDGSVLHLADNYGVIIGKHVTVGHKAMVHACTIEDECLIGMGSIILDGAVIGHNSIVGAGAVVPPGMKVPPGSMVLGIPAKIVKTLTPEEQARIKNWALKYEKVSQAHKAKIEKAAKA